MRKEPEKEVGRSGLARSVNSKKMLEPPSESSQIKTWTTDEIAEYWDGVTIEKFISKADLMRIIDEAEKSTGFCGIGEWEDPYDIRLILDFIAEFKRRMGL